MKKIRSSKKGFTLAELLIVVAIIGVLVGISIPIFSAQLKKSRVATNQANARAAYAAAKSEYLDAGEGLIVKYVVDTGVATKIESSDVDTNAATEPTAIKDWTTTTANVPDKVATTWYVTVDDDGAVTAIKGLFPS